MPSSFQAKILLGKLLIPPTLFWPILVLDLAKG